METTVIVAVVDVIDALANDRVSGSLYLVDNRKAEGSTDEGTETLKTCVKKGDQLMWTTLSLECEAFATISGIEIDAKYCSPERRFFPGTDVAFWTGRVKKDLAEPVPYILRFLLGTRSEEMSMPDTPETRPSLVSGLESADGLSREETT